MTSRIFIAVSILAVIGLGAFFIYPKFKDHHDHVNIPKFVQEAIHAYQAQGVGAFVEFSDQENPQWVQDKGETYIFVINAMSSRLVAHGGGLTDPTGSAQALINYLVAMAKEQPEGRWVYYGFKNPRTGETELKRAFIRVHDDYIFGSGEYRRKRR